MNRRRLLAAGVAGIVGVAGCISGPDEPSTDAGDVSTGASTGTATSSPSPTRTRTPPANVSVAVEWLQPAALKLNTDAYGVDGVGQHLSVRLTAASDDPPSYSSLGFRFDGDETSPVPIDAATTRLARLFEDREGAYDAESGAGWVQFALPESGDASDAALTWPGGEWRPGDVLRARLAAPDPPLSVDWSVPGTVERGVDPEMEFVVTNEGDVTGRFVAGVNRVGPSIAYAPAVAVSRPIPPGTTDTWTVRDDSVTYRSDADGSSDGEPEAKYHLVWTGGRRTRAVRVVDG